MPSLNYQKIQPTFPTSTRQRTPSHHSHGSGLSLRFIQSEIARRSYVKVQRMDFLLDWQITCWASLVLGFPQLRVSLEACSLWSAHCTQQRSGLCSQWIEPSKLPPSSFWPTCHRSNTRILFLFFWNLALRVLPSQPLRPAQCTNS